MRLFTDRTEYETTVNAVTEALSDPHYRLVKAVVKDPDSSNPTDEKIIGFVHYLCAGYIQLEKVDPFAPKVTLDTSEANIKDAKDVTSNMAEVLSEQANEAAKQDAERAERLRRGEMKYVETRNVYIAAIRGKKHMFIRRIMVLPEYQRRGVASKLMKIVTDEADQLKIVCWLFARPAGEPLYQKVGYKTVATFEMDEPGLRCPPTKAMMRLPQPVEASGTN